MPLKFDIKYVRWRLIPGHDFIYRWPVDTNVIHYDKEEFDNYTVNCKGAPT